MEKKNFSYTNCPGCGRHCPVEELHCDRGRAILAGEQPAEASHHHSEGHHHLHNHFSKGDDSLSYLLQCCTNALPRSERNGEAQQRVLRILTRKGEMNQCELQEHLHIKPGSLSELISKLEHKGLLTRKHEEEDKRKIILCLTEAGKNAIEENGSCSDRDDFFNVLSDEEKETLRVLLQKLMGTNEYK